jgi:hypothetical protein
MIRLIILDLTDDERTALTKGHRHGKSHAFHTRCHMILLKADRLTSAQVADALGDLGKEFSAMTLKRFLKNTVAATSD